MNQVIHLVPEWPTKYQTFVQDDIEVSRSSFNKVDIFGFRIAENNDIEKYFFWIKKICLVIRGILVLFLICYVVYLMSQEKYFPSKLFFNCSQLLENFLIFYISLLYFIAIFITDCASVCRS